MLRNFSWNYFASTGDIDAYLLYREHPDSVGFMEEELGESVPSDAGESTACL